MNFILKKDIKQYFIKSFSIYFLPLIIIVNIQTISNRNEIIKILLVVSVSFVLSTLLVRKFNFSDSNYSYKRFYYSYIIMIGILANFLYLFKDLRKYNIFLITSLFISFILETLWLKIFLKNKLKISGYESKESKNFELKYFLINLFLFIISFIPYNKVLLINLSQGNNLLFVIGVFIFWLISIRLTYNFSIDYKVNYWNFIWDHFKSYFIYFSLLFFFFSLVSFNRAVFNPNIKSFILYVCISFSYYSFSYLRKKNLINYDPVRFKLIKATTIDYDEIERKVYKDRLEKYALNGNVCDKEILKEQLKKVYLKDYEFLANRLENRVDLSTICLERVKVLRSRDEYNVNILEDKGIDLFINLHSINDFRRINNYFITVHKKLVYGGIFILNFEPLEKRYKRFLKKYPFVIARVFYFLDFIFYRVLPKLPIFQKIYFYVTDGKNRAISFSEVLGRLRYCGFEILDVFLKDNLVYVMAIKKGVPSQIVPSYGLFFKMQRIGKNGNFINVYKLRTMYPFSEFIQDLAYKINNLDIGGKIKNDFRITTWGRILRFFWIDELPMLINFFKGELKLVGVRPLSKHYFELYPEDLKNLRLKTKPGLIPPFYFDLPKTLDEIFESERRYLKSYFKNPIKTDVKYFFKAAYNILIKGARSR